MKMIASTALALALLAAVPMPAMAQTGLEATRTCLADNTSGKDRKLLAKWVFLAMAAHPEIRNLSQATASDREQASRDLGVLFTRLVTQDCAVQMRAMVQESGSASIGTAFQFLGEVAMQELMTHPDVNGVFSGFEKYVDQGKVEKVFVGSSRVDLQACKLEYSIVSPK